MSAGTCECTCLGCEHFHGEPAEGQDAHHARLLLALDRSIAAACRSRGIVACDGLSADQPCEVGTLHTKAGELARALAKFLEDPWHEDYGGNAHNAFSRLLDEFARITDGKPRLS